MRGVLSASLLTGPLPIVVTVLGGLGLVWLVIKPQRRFLLLTAPVCIVGGVALTGLGYVVVEKIWQPFPDPLPLQLYVWVGLAIVAVALMSTRVRRPVSAAVTSVLAAILVIATSALHVNQEFGAYPTIGSLVGASTGVVVPAQDVIGKKARTTVTVSKWKAPNGLPEVGERIQHEIPGEKSGFHTRPAEIYLPPAYFSDPRPLLPVLVLLAGNPGKPGDWLQGGRLIETMDDYVAEHGGLSPVVVVADGTGSLMANPLCVDSPLGNAATYLSTDVPAWIEDNLQIDPNPKSWAIGGLSYGGTCALQLATNYPQVYPTFLDMSGQLEPTLGDRQRTLDAAFDGSAAAFDAVNPLNLLSTKRFPDSAGVFVVGAQDAQYLPGIKRLFEAAKAAGMDVRYSEIPGTHSFVVWSEGLKQQLPWLSRRLGLPE